MGLECLPELASFDSHGEGVRIPPGVTVPLTSRVRRLLDTAEMRRLSRVGQLGLVSLVYPGATHGRLEHSLGVYRLALEFLARLRHEPRFATTVDEPDAAAFLVAALVHDIGHWPFCHPIEDMGLPIFPRHEALVHGILAAGEPARLIAADWGLGPERIASLIAGTANDPAGRLLHSLLSGPIDVDKMDYLRRDSLHAGVPYGLHYDEDRLLSSLCLDGSGTALAITEKGRTAAEMLVFARYVMFSEVYWHHAVRSATAMLQRSIWHVRGRIDPQVLVRLDDRAFVESLMKAAARTPAAALLEGLFGERRVLFKRVATFDALRHPTIHRALAGRSYGQKLAIAERLAAAIGFADMDDSILIDAPPVEREVEFTLDVRERNKPADGRGTFTWTSFSELSPVVRSLAHQQFDEIVKRVRIFAPAEVAAKLHRQADLEDILLEAAGGV